MTRIDLDPNLNRMDLDQLRSLRDALAEEVAATHSAVAAAASTEADPKDTGCSDDEDPWAGLRNLETRLHLVHDEIWRREDAQVDAQTLAAYTTTGAAWSDIDQEWPLARPAWDREIGPAGGGLRLLVYVGPPRQALHGNPLRNRWLLALDESHGCRLRGPLDKGTHPAGCRCRLWSSGTEHWVDLAREGLVFSMNPGDQVEGVLLGRGADATFLRRGPTPLDPPQRTSVGTWLVQPADRLPLSLLTSTQLESVLPGLVDQTVRLARLSDCLFDCVIRDCVIRDGFRRAQYAARPVLLAEPARGSLSHRDLGVLGRAPDWLREDWSGAIADGLRWIGADPRRPPKIARQDVVMKLVVLAQYAHSLFRVETADAIAKLRDAVSAREEPTT